MIDYDIQLLSLAFAIVPFLLREPPKDAPFLNTELEGL